MTKFVLVAFLTAFSFSAQAETVVSEDVQASVARVVQLVTLVEKPGLQVSVTVVDHGGSTDVSPTQTVYLTLYSKGEMFSPDATFKIADVLKFNGARRISGGIYEIKAMTYTDEDIAQTTYTIDAKKAVTDIQVVDCLGEFNCEASSKFKPSVEVTTIHNRLSRPL